MATGRERALYSALLLLSAFLCLSASSTPLIAWSNTDIFASSSSSDVLDILSLVEAVEDKLKELDFIIVFGAKQLSFDDIAKFAGLYGDAKHQPLASLQTAVTAAKSSIWGGTKMASSLVDEISMTTYTSSHHLSSLIELPQTTGSVQLFTIDFSSAGTPEEIFSQHGSAIEEVMNELDSLSANYAAFYTATQGEDKSYMASYVKRRAAGVALGEGEESNSTEKGMCANSAVITEVNKTTGEILDYCALLCMRATDYPIGTPEEGEKSEDTIPLKAIFWESWITMSNETAEESKRRCYMTTFEFDYESAKCSNSSLQEDLDNFNLTSMSIMATMNGSCGYEYNVTINDPISLKVEFIFFGKSEEGKLTPLPGLQGSEEAENQVLPSSFWTMQLVVNKDGESHYLTRYRTDLELEATEDSNNLTEAKGLFYPFAIPYGLSYSCLTYDDHLLLLHGNLNRFVATRNPFVKESEMIADGPVLQFVGLQVQAYGSVFSLSLGKNATQLIFDTVYDCEGYFDISSWMGTFAVVIIVVMLYFAILCIFAMQTVDRFDDPRGQTISVENLH